MTHTNLTIRFYVRKRQKNSPPYFVGGLRVWIRSRLLSNLYAMLMPNRYRP